MLTFRIELKRRILDKFVTTYLPSIFMIMINYLPFYMGFGTFSFRCVSGILSILSLVTMLVNVRTHDLL
jgi:hypothetical protein